jgi:hypothetical protein
MSPDAIQIKSPPDYRFGQKHEPNGGYRLYRNDRSILLQMLGTGQRHADELNLATGQHIVTALDELRSELPLKVDVKRMLRHEDFPPVIGTAFYKYVSDRTWNYISSGRFQLGSASYYRAAEDPNARDCHEGLGWFHIQSGDYQATVALASGFNAGLFCGFGAIPNDADHQFLKKRFGPRLLKIDPVDQFVKRIKRRIGAFRTRIHDVIYTDTMGFTFQHELHPRRINDILQTGSLADLNREYFATFYELSVLPSLCAKPSAFAREHERRLIFEMRGDLEASTIPIDDKVLLDFITVVET